MELGIATKSDRGRGSKKEKGLLFWKKEAKNFGSAVAA
jgi:hypothetical protein